MTRGAGRGGSVRDGGGGSSMRCGSSTGAALARGFFAFAGGASTCSSSISAVDRNRAESGPSRMLARLPRSMSQNLLSQTSVGEGRLTVGVVLEHRHSLHRSLGKTNRLRYARGKYPVSKVLFE